MLVSGPMTTGGDVRLYEFAGDRLVYLADQELDNRIEAYSALANGRGAVTKLNGPLDANGATLLEVTPDGRTAVFRAERANGVRQKGVLLPHRLEQDGRCVPPNQRERDPGQAGAGADVDERERAGWQVRHQSERVGEMLIGERFRGARPRQIDPRPPFEDEAREPRERLEGLVRDANPQLLGRPGQARLQPIGGDGAFHVERAG